MSAGPRGRLSRGALEDSRFYPRTRRDYWVYTPPGHEADVPAALMVFQDREAYVADDGWFRVPRVFDRLIAEGRMPPTVGVFANAGRRPAGR